MMGRTHALTGVLATSGTAMLTGADVPSGLLILSLLPGFALFNDLDHPKSTASNTFGGLTKIPSLFLGHRRETHSIPGILAIAGGTHLAVINQGNVAANIWLMFVLCVGWLSVLRVTRLDRKINHIKWLPVLVSLAVVWYPKELAMVHLEFPLHVLPIALGAGMFVHLIGDIVTKQPCPLLWPLSKKGTSFKWFKTNGFGEQIATGVIVLGIVTSTGQWFLVLANDVVK